MRTGRDFMRGDHLNDIANLADKLVKEGMEEIYIHGSVELSGVHFSEPSARGGAG
jgi:hypothetical protein